MQRAHIYLINALVNIMRRIQHVGAEFSCLFHVCLSSPARSLVSDGPVSIPSRSQGNKFACLICPIVGTSIEKKHGDVTHN